MFRSLMILGACGALLTTAQAEDWPGRSTEGLRFFADQAAFKGGSDRSLVEFYFLLEAAQLQYVPEGGKFVGEMDMSVAIQDSAGQTVEESSWTRRLAVEDLSRLSEGGLLYRDVTGLQVPPGAYQAVLSVEDMFGDLAGEMTLPLTVPNLGTDKLTSSDLVIASSAKPVEKSSKFTKSGYEVVPKPTRKYLVGDSLNAYVELYNLSPGDTPRAKTFVMGYSLTDTGGVTVKSYPAVRLEKAGASAAKTFKADTKGLRPGRYFFEVEALDYGTRQHIKKRRSVVLASDKPEEEPELTDEQLTQLGYYKSIKILASKEDMKVYDQLKGDDHAQMKFLRQFWKKLDPTPGTDINERLIEHLRRMRHSDGAYSGRAGQLGSETAMGRVYIQYGAPDDIERDASGGLTKPYEIWQYGRYEFVFQDRNALGHYELVHSDYPGELNNPMWRQQTF